MRTSVPFLLAVAILGCRPDRLTPVPPCEPDPNPTEICDGRDNNCDGRIDEELYRPCSTACGNGTEICSLGMWAYCSVRQPTEEVCDRVDNDCDGMVDEGLPVEPCYPSNTNELSNGECRFGIKRCSQGTFQCLGAVTPKQETCNNLDDDCDGKIDEDLDGGADIVFIIDTSCSMYDKIDYLKTATSSWVMKYGAQTDIKFAIVLAPNMNGGWNDEIVTHLPLSDVASFVTSLSVVNDNGSGNEPTLDAIYLTCQALDPLGLGWTPGSGRSIVLYTDEEPQSHPELPDGGMHPSLPGRITSQMARAALTDAGMKITTFTQNPLINYSGSPSNNLWDMAFNPHPFLYGQLFDQELDKAIQGGRCQ